MPPKHSSNHDALLNEYQACISDNSQLDNDVWQSGSVFIGVSVVGTSLLIQVNVVTITSVFAHISIALVGIIILLVWLIMVRRWLMLIEINFYRMREIETEVGCIWKERYIKYLDNPNNAGDLDDQETSKRYLALRQQFHGENVSYKINSKSHYKLLRFIVFILLLTWVLLIIKVLSDYLVLIH